MIMIKDSSYKLGISQIAIRLFEEKNFIINVDCPGCLKNYMVEIKINNVEEEAYKEHMFRRNLLLFSLKETHRCVQKYEMMYDYLIICLSLGTLISYLPVIAQARENPYHLMYKEVCKNTSFGLAKRMYACLTPCLPLANKFEPTIGTAQVLSEIKSQQPEYSLKKIIQEYYCLTPTS